MKIGFLAMSGVRVRDLELMELGLTLPGFVERSKVIASLPSLGLLTLAGMTPSEWERHYVEIPEPSELEELPGPYDVVAISSFSAQIKEAYALAARYRRAGVTVVLGGLHVSVCPQEAVDHADAVVVGEGELVWPEVLRDYAAGRLQRLYRSPSPGFDLAHAPMPAFELLDLERYNRLTVQTTRGCPFRCEFCAASIRISPRYKIKPVAKVMEEIDRIRELWPRPFIEFADDNTFVNKKAGRELARALIPRGVRWFTETDISVAEDSELLELLRESGCAQILIGLESPSQKALEGVEQRGNWKARQWTRYRQAIERIQSHGITVNGCFVLGLDGIGPESFDDVYRFIADSGLYEAQVTVMTPFPGTPLYERLVGAGRILKPGAWERCTLFDVNFHPEQMTADELSASFRELIGRVYENRFVASRRRRFRNNLRRLRRASRANGRAMQAGPAVGR